MPEILNVLMRIVIGQRKSDEKQHFESTQSINCQRVTMNAQMSLNIKFDCRVGSVDCMQEIIHK